jgi:hypothetical protein
MKVRFSEQHVRLRLSEDDVSFLKSGKSLTLSVRFSPLEALDIVVQPWEMAVISATFLYNELKVYLPTAALIQWAESEQEGMYTLQQEGLEQPLKISIEKDFPCTHSPEKTEPHVAR